MSTITFTCYACNQVLKVGADKAGKKAKCIKCGTILTIPMETPEAPPEEVEEEAAPAPAKGKGRAAEEDFEEDRPRRRPRDDDDEDEAPRSKRRRDDDDEDDEPRSKRRRDDDDEDDEPRGRRGRDDDDEDDDRGRRGGGPGVFERQGLTTVGTIFTFSGVGLLVFVIISVFFPWRKVDISLPPGIKGDIPGGKFEMKMEMPGMPSVSAAGIKTTAGIIVLILSILGIAFVMVALFVLNQLVFKISLWSAFGCGVVDTFWGVMAALIKSTPIPMAPISEVGAWGAWVAMIVSLLASVMFILAVLSLKRVGAPARKGGGDDFDDEDDDDRGSRSRKPSRDDDEDLEDEEPRPKKRRPRDDDDD
jgi:hypothetical protein